MIRSFERLSFTSVENLYMNEITLPATSFSLQLQARLAALGNLLATAILGICAALLAVVWMVPAFLVVGIVTVLPALFLILLPIELLFLLGFVVIQTVTVISIICTGSKRWGQRLESRLQGLRRKLMNKMPLGNFYRAVNRLETASCKIVFTPAEKAFEYAADYWRRIPSIGLS